MKELILKLSQIESIQILSDGGLDFEDIDYCCGEILAIFVEHDHGLIIGEDTMGGFFPTCILKFKKVINNKSQLHASIKQNLGFMYNQYRIQLPNLSSDFVEILSQTGESFDWVGLNYNVWSSYNTTKPMVTTWLYNDMQGNIIFEVTPLYKWAFFPDDPENPDFVTYAEFMENYQVLISRVIPRDVAITWLDQMMKVYRSLFESQEQYENMCKRFGWKNE